MIRRALALLALLAVAASALTACCGDCIKDPPCCGKNLEKK